MHYSLDCCSRCWAAVDVVKRCPGVAKLECRIHQPAQQCEARRIAPINWAVQCFVFGPFAFGLALVRITAYPAETRIDAWIRAADVARHDDTSAMCRRAMTAAAVAPMLTQSVPSMRDCVIHQARQLSVERSVIEVKMGGGAFMVRAPRASARRWL